MVKQSTVTRGIHLIAEFSGCDSSILNDAAKIESVLVRSVENVGSGILAKLFHRFRPDGVTGCVMAHDAHVTIHTWPNTGYASVDLYCANSQDLEHARELLARDLCALKSQSVQIERGTPGKHKLSVSGHRRVQSYYIDCRDAQLPDTVFVGKSPNRGFGLFAKRDFVKNELIYTSLPELAEWDAEFIVDTDVGKSHHDADSLGYELRLPLIDRWSDQVRNAIAEHFELPIVTSLEILRCVTGEGEREVLITGFDGLINHSNTPNVLMKWSDATIAFDNEFPTWQVPTRALQPIAQGEELLVDYRVSLSDFEPPDDWLP